MTYALIGCGRIAVNHMKAALNNKLNIVAVCDVLPEKMEELLAKYDLQNDDSIARYTDYKKLLAEHPDLQLASIATESGIHAEIALACIDAGVNVIIEKPMAMSMDDADEIIRRSACASCATVSRSSAAARKSTSRWPPATRTASTWRCRRCAMLWKPDALAACPTAASTSAGTGIGITTIRHRGAAPGRRTAAA